MIVHGCIEIHPKNCGGWIILMGFRVLLIFQHLFWEILVDAVLGVHVRGVKIIFFSSRCYNDASSTQMVYGGLLVLVCTWRTICS
jgi:hypothetical protein